MDPQLTIRFLGGAQTVTGSKYLVAYNEHQILVDCGLFQGLKELRLKNWDRFPIDPKTIDAVVLTHAHIDHSGYLPRLVREGFRGPIFATAATTELCKVMLMDSAHLQEEQAEWMNRRKISKHHPALPLYTTEDAEKCLELFRPQNFDSAFPVAKGFQARFLYAGHILGAAMIVLESPHTKVGFSGDVGRPSDDLLLAPKPLPPVDYLILESTYGDRKHLPTQPTNDLRDLVLEAVKNNGVVLIPAFTVGRTQTLMHALSELRRQGQIPQIPMYLNSPMATSATTIFQQNPDLHKLTSTQCQRMTDDFIYIKSVEESKLLNEKKGPMIIIAGSGMATGGRILHHLEAFAENPKNVIVLSGFQAAGTRGRLLQEGAKEIKIHGRMVPINATVKTIENLSAHADYSEIIAWLKGSNFKAKKVFITHGEPFSTVAMKSHVQMAFNIPSEIPSQDQQFVLD